LILVIDNYDSFVHNLARYLRELGCETEVVRNDEIDVDAIASRRPSHIVLSPGPCTPNEAGVSVELIRALGPSIPMLGVCLGHQCIGQALGGRIVRALRPMHGRTSLVRHVGDGVFAGLPNPLQATRYHSLVVASESLPEELIATAYSEEGEIMALRHRSLPIVGVQFHPEAVLTQHGYDLLRNFLEGVSSSDSPRPGPRSSLRA
jgi:anthranilate synthase/aminodeoxychorismate synthase-like glutamine amidotransferase